MKSIIAILIAASTALAQGQTDRFEAGPLFSGTFLREIGSSDHGVGTSALGIGGRLVYSVFPHLDLEAEGIVWPNNQATSGNWIQGFFGAKTGHRFSRFGVFAKVRPGILHFRKDPFGATLPGNTLLHTRWATSTEPALDAGGVLEYYTAGNRVIRFDLGDTVLHYGRRDVALSQTQQVSRGGFTTHNWQGSLGFNFRF